MPLLDHATALDELTAQGAFLTAIQRYFHPRFTFLDPETGQAKGKAAKMELVHHYVQAQGNFRRGVCHHTFQQGNVTLSEFTFEWDHPQRGQTKVQQVIKRIWEDNRVVQEIYFSMQPRLEQTRPIWNRLFREKWLELPIPDQDRQGIQSYMLFEQEGTVREVLLGIDIEHDYPGDIQVILKSPSGKSWFIHTRDWKPDTLHRLFTQKELEEVEGESIRGLWELQVIDHAASHQGTFNWWCLEVLFDHEDDLTRIEGIGPKIAEVLKGAAITTFRQLALLQPEEIQAALKAAGSNFQLHNPETWPFQASLAVAGDWNKLNEVQELMRGGRWRE